MSKISLRTIAALYDKRASKPLAAEFRRIRDDVNAFLDGDTICVINEEEITRRRVLDVFLYGGLAHAEPDKAAVYDFWEQLPMMSGLLRNEFVLALAYVCSAIESAMMLNQALVVAA